ncbi:MAG: greA [Rickettsiaceae bacterium]|jgi:transcription elongation factor GreA|nr:greA [Rickettsiaceae bacterium]
MEKFLITKEGIEKLRAEVKHLKEVERPNIIKAVATARELGDLKENAEYHSAREKQGMIEATISNLEDKLARSEVVDVASLSGDLVRFGATVKLENADNGKKVVYKIVSEYEADIDSGLISNVSPVAMALMGKQVGDEIEIKTPGGVVDYEILEIYFK